ncbi:MAG TPA: hypothetical protein VFQ23_19530 [Anaerolineales bacterium]|nr:hypothetical protein [Anaerolineales bacterium]
MLQFDYPIPILKKETSSNDEDMYSLHNGKPRRGNFLQAMQARPAGTANA